MEKSRNSYNQGEEYKIRRETLNKLVSKAWKDSRLQNLSQEINELIIKLKNLNFKDKKLKCTYCFRKGQNISFENFRGSFIDTWERSYNYNLPLWNEDDEEDISLETTKPFTIFLRSKAPSINYKQIHEYTGCLHPDCIKLKNRKKSEIIFLLCRKHATTELIYGLNNFIKKKPVEEKIKDIGIGATVFLTTYLFKDLTSQIFSFKQLVNYPKYEKPEKVIMIDCIIQEKDEEETTIFIDLIKCAEIKRKKVMKIIRPKNPARIVFET